jgi:hypothetical protein
MSRQLERRVDQLLARVRDLELELSRLRGAEDQARRGFAEVCLAAPESGDTLPAGLTAVSGGAQTIAAGQASIMEIVGGTLKPIANSAGGNKLKVDYLNAAKSTPSEWTDQDEPMLLVRLRDGRWIRFPGGGGDGSSPTELVAFELASDLAKTRGAAAPAHALAPNTLTGSTTPIVVLNPGHFRAFSGAEGIAAKLGDDYWVLEVDQPALFVRVQLADHPNNSGGTVRYAADPREANAAFTTSSPSPVVLTSFPYSFLPSLASGLVPNPLDLFGETGDAAILQWNADAEAYFLAAVFPSKQTELYVTLASNLPTGALTPVVSCNLAAPSSDGAITTPVNVVDRYNVMLNARSGDRALVRWQPRTTAAGSGEYQFVVGSHRATRARAVVASGGFTGSPATFIATATHGYDGPLSGDVIVQNRFNWDTAEAGLVLDIAWDNIGNVWYAVECQDAYIRGLRISGYKYQYTRNGTTWIDWATGEECAP